MNNAYSTEGGVDFLYKKGIIKKAEVVKLETTIGLGPVEIILLWVRIPPSAQASENPFRGLRLLCSLGVQRTHSPNCAERSHVRRGEARRQCLRATLRVRSSPHNRSPFWAFFICFIHSFNLILRWF